MNEKQFRAICAKREVNVDACADMGKYWIGVSRVDKRVVLQELTFMLGAKGNSRVIDIKDVRAVRSRDASNPVNGWQGYYLELELNDYDAGMIELLTTKQKVRDDIYSKLSFLLNN